MKINKLHILLTIFAVSLACSSCIPGQNIPEEDYLLNRNRIKIEDADINSHELEAYVRQKPNRRTLGLFRFHLYVYQIADKRDNGRISHWLKNNIGEPPVIFDPRQAEQTEQQFELYLQNKGYFNASVQKDIDYRGNRADVTYTLKGNKPYTINDIHYIVRDPHLEPYVYADTTESLIRSGEHYDTEILQDERNRITRNLKEKGFFRFSRDYIHFQADSTVNNNKVDIDFIIHNPDFETIAQTDSAPAASHKKYKINEMVIYPDYKQFTDERHHPDTTVLRADNSSNQTGDIIFLHNGPMHIKPEALTNNIFFQPGEYYDIHKVEQTHHYLAGLRNFRFVNIQFDETISDEPELSNDTLGHMDVGIELTRSPANAFTIEAEGLNTAGNLGIATNLLYQNRNLFGGAEMFNIRLKGALEASGESGDEEAFSNLPFNTAEMGADFSIDFPKLIFPFHLENLARTGRPKTTLLTGLNYRQRPDYTRYILNFSYGFQWSYDDHQQHQLTPLEISSIKIFNDSILQSNIPDSNPLIMSRYSDHLIAGLKYEYIYNTQEIDVSENFLYLRGNFESAGNLLYLSADRLNLSRNHNDRYTIRDIPFAQYLKADADFRYYRVFDENNSLVFRLMGGIGVPYGNLDVMPFIKSYYGGGANSIRAWSIYNLGPGGYQAGDDLRFDKYGDIKLEANIEQRFSIYRYWEGAFFLDAGNVWFLQDNEQFPGGAFSADRFYKEIAIGAGMGIRLDFNFFIVRLDGAFPIRDPAMPPGDRWVSRWSRLNQWNFNLGIGYPF